MKGLQNHALMQEINLEGKPGNFQFLIYSFIH